MDIVQRITDNFPELAAAMAAVPPHFSPNWLMQAASNRTGLDDFGDQAFMTGLERLCQSLNEDAHLNAYGRLLLSGQTTNHLSNRLLLQQMRKQHPERTSEGTLEGPIIVSGLPRTGTTFLHRLLSADPAHAFLPYWQVYRPIPLSEADTPQARIQETEALMSIRLKLTPELDKTHLIRPDSPEECFWMSSLSMVSRLFFNMAPVYSYQRWVSRTDKTAKYRDYHDLLCYLQGEHLGKRLVLKAPEHNDGLHELLTAIPSARVVLTHRNMIEQMGSYFSLGRLTRKIAVTELDTKKEAEAVIDMTDVSLQKMAEARLAHPGKILDVRYTDMMADPLKEVERIYSFCGLALSQDRRDALAQHHQNNPKGKHGEHQYSLAEFGLENDWVAEHYRDYTAQFIA